MDPRFTAPVTVEDAANLGGKLLEPDNYPRTSRFTSLITSRNTKRTWTSIPVSLTSSGTRDRVEARVATVAAAAEAEAVEMKRDRQRGVQLRAAAKKGQSC